MIDKKKVSREGTERILVLCLSDFVVLFLQELRKPLQSFQHPAARAGNVPSHVTFAFGAIHVAGRHREDIAELIKGLLIKENLVKDPNVTVEFMNLRISVLGEVNTPGCYSIDRDCMTVVDALSLAGDLTIYGNRTKVMVLRQEDGMQRVYGLDLTSGENVYSSPAYYLQQNDIIYVEPNKVKARQSTVNGNNVRSTSFWISLASLLTSVAILILN